MIEDSRNGAPHVQVAAIHPALFRKVMSIALRLGGDTFTTIGRLSTCRHNEKYVSPEHLPINK